MLTIAAALALSCVVFSPPAFAQTNPSVPSAELPRYKEIQPNVRFWKDVFARYSADQVVLHDRERLDIVYSIVDVADIRKADVSAYKQEREVQHRIDAEIARVDRVLRRVAAGKAQTPEERRVASLVKDSLGRTARASELVGRIRPQRGLADKLCPAMERASRYLPQMRGILSAHGVPESLAALPLVESSFRIDAHSHAGATGMWQFTRGTGKRFLRIEYLYDDRRDPLRATEAAAKYLRENYEKLGSWPLAITAYNHGAGGLEDAVRKFKTSSFPVILRKYDGRRFGFASRNFYAEFLAAMDVIDQVGQYCGSVEASPLQLTSVELRHFVPIKDLAAASDLSVDELAELNPALHRDVVIGKLFVPRGYQLNLPSGKAAAFRAAYAALPTTALNTAQNRVMGTHRVARGQTLSHIANIYRTSVEALRAYNNISDPRRLRVGQTIRVPLGGTRKGVASAHYRTHRVRTGQTLSHIAKLYGTSVPVLIRTNRISDPTRLRSGQLIKVPM